MNTETRGSCRQTREEGHTGSYGLGPNENDPGWPESDSGPGEDAVDANATATPCGDRKAGGLHVLYGTFSVSRSYAANVQNHPMCLSHIRRTQQSVNLTYIV